MAFHWLFAAGLLLYLLTRFIALDKFPIYFFSDEAIQTLSASDLIGRGFKDISGRLFPVYFENGGQYNLSFSVWLQVLVAWLPRSIWLTRGLPALVSTVFPLTVGLSLRRFFKAKHWWLAPFLVAALPAWFLHSRTAFETSLGAALFSVFLYFYLRYRLENRKFLPLALLFGALAFYTYSPLQLVVVLTGLLLLISDWKFHFADRRAVLKGLGVLLLAAAPYLLFRYLHAGSLTGHLRMLDSYWITSIPLADKLGLFFQNYLRGLDPRYWFFYNTTDLVRHQMKGLGHVPWFLLPFALAGLERCVRGWREPGARLVLISLLTAPTGAALAGVAITRLLVMVVPLAYLSLVGLEMCLTWLREKWNSLIPAALTALAMAVFSVGMLFAAVRDGLTWYPDYGLYGMQWGGQQLAQKIETIQAENPGRELILSPSWANNTDVIMRFFLGTPLPVKVDTIEAWNLYQVPLSRNTLFIMTPEELLEARENPKFTHIEVEDTLFWPDGRPGFLFVSLEYVEDIDRIFAEELAERQRPQHARVTLLGQEVEVTYPLLDIGTIEAVFDADANSLIRGFEANPLVLRLAFSEPVSLEGIRVTLGSNPSRLQANLQAPDGDTHTFTVIAVESDQIRTVSVTFDQAYEVTWLEISVENLYEGQPSHVHVWEIEFEE